MNCSCKPEKEKGDFSDRLGIAKNGCRDPEGNCCLSLQREVWTSCGIIVRGGSLFTYLYFEEMNIDPKDPKNPVRNRFVLSKGHVAPGYSSTLANRGYFPVENLKTLRHTGSYL